MKAEERACVALCQCRNGGRSRGTAYHSATCLYLQNPAADEAVSNAIRAAERDAAAEELSALAVAYGGDSEYRVKIEAGGLLAYLADRIAELRGEG